MANYEITIMTRGSSEFKTDYTERQRSGQVAGGAGWYATERQTLPDRMGNVALVNSGPAGVLINSKLLTLLAANEARHYPVAVTYGNVRWYQFMNTDLQERLAFHIKYPPRSETEARVRERTREIVNWLLRLQADAFEARRTEAVA